MLIIGLYWFRDVASARNQTPGGLYNEQKVNVTHCLFRSIRFFIIISQHERNDKHRRYHHISFRALAEDLLYPPAATADRN